MRKSIATARVVCLLAASVLVLGSCAGLGASAIHPDSYFYFAAPTRQDAWSPKIAGWQRRERADQGDLLQLASVAGEPASGIAPSAQPGSDQASLPAGDLRSKYFGFRAERKRGMALEFAAWIQSQSKHHYVADGPIDHWATLEETLQSNGDDCDGLELLTFHALRDLGFAENEVYRAIVYRPSDGQHHMVTLWFEDRADPWVIDPTGAMTTGMPHMSELPGWVPLKVFSDTVEYTVRPLDEVAAGTSLAAVK